MAFQRNIKRNNTLLASALFVTLTGCDKLQDLPVAVGFSAKNICTGLFLSKIEEKTLINDLIAPEVKPVVPFWKINVDRDKKSVTVTTTIGASLIKSDAYYREGLGCTLGYAAKGGAAALYAQQPAQMPKLTLPTDLPWPNGSAGVSSTPVAGVNYTSLTKAIDDAFVENERKTRNTMAIVVAYNGKMIAEKYDPRVNAFTPLAGWSLSKTVTSTLVGILSDRGKINVNAPAPIPEWASTDKASITVKNLLHLSSGLDFHEVTAGPNKDLSTMLYLKPDMVKFMVDLPLAHTPGEFFNYSTGETNITAKIIGNTLGGTVKDVNKFYQEELFHKIKIANAVGEHDAVGTLMGGSGFFMPARDWARLGQLYLQQGQWGGQQIISKEWLKAALTPAPSKPTYGYQIWLNLGQESWPQLPEDTFSFRGYAQQIVTVVPSKKLVVVRNGFSFEKEIAQTEKLVADVIASLP